MKESVANCGERKQGHVATLLQGVKHEAAATVSSLTIATGRYLRTQSAQKHRKKPICPRPLARRAKSPDGDRSGVERGITRRRREEASTRTGERREAAAQRGIRGNKKTRKRHTR